MLQPLSLSMPVIVVILALPGVYVLNGFSPWSQALWRRGDRDAYVPFWTSVGVLHWTTAGVVLAVLVASGQSLSALAVGADTVTVAGSGVLAAGVMLGFGSVVLRADPLPEDTLEMPRHGALPAETRERVCFFATAVVAASICEEFVYRAVGIPALLGVGVPLSAAIPVTSLSFVFVHGVAPLRKPVLFVVYFAMGVVFAGVFVLTESLLIAIVVHATVNALQAIGGTRSRLAAGEQTANATDGEE